MPRGSHPSSLLLAAIFAAGIGGILPANSPATRPESEGPRYATALHPELIGGEVFGPPAPDLELGPEGVAKAEALARFAEGILFEEAAEPAKALAAYLAVLDRDPGNTDLAVRVAYELSQSNDVTRAIRILKDAIAAGPRSPLPHLQLAWIYARQVGRLDQALRHISLAAEIAPTDGDVIETQVQILVEAGQPSRAQAALDRALRAKDATAEFLVRIAELQARLARPDPERPPNPEAIRRAASAIERAAAKSAGNIELLHRLGDLHTALERPADASLLYRKAIESGAALPEEARLLIQEKLARSLLGEGKTEEAAAALREIIRVDPTRSEVHELLGAILEEQGDLRAALLQFEQVVLLNPGLPAAHLRLADLLLRTGEPGKSAQALTEARARFPGLPQLTSALGVAYSQSKRHDEAIAAFEQAIHEAHVAGRTDLLDAGFYFQYGAACEQAGQHERAAELLTQSIELDPKQAAPALNYLGYMWADRGERLDEAETLIRKALVLDPDNGAYRDSLGWVLFRKARYPEALRELLRAAELVQPPDPVVLDHIGDAYEKNGNPGQAAAYWKKASELDPSNTALAEKARRGHTVLGDATPAPKSPEPTPRP